MNRGKALVALGAMAVILTVCLVVSLGYIELYTERTRRSRLPTLSETEMNSTLLTCHRVQKLVDTWQRGLYPTKMYASYRVNIHDVLSPTGESIFEFSSAWHKGVFEVLGVPISNAVVVVDASSGRVAEFTTWRSDRGTGLELAPSQWPWSDRELLSIAEDYGGREFRSACQDASIAVRIVGTSVGDEWLQSYGCEGRSRSILINLTSGELKMRDDSNEWQLKAVIRHD